MAKNQSQSRKDDLMFKDEKNNDRIKKIKKIYSNL